MTVFVDDMYKVPMGKFRRMKMSHMVADTDDELHAMADRIGVARRWHQGDHYDICMSKRDEAVRLGAVEVTQRVLSMWAFCRRHKLPCTIENAEDVARQFFQDRSAARDQRVTSENSGAV